MGDEVNEAANKMFSPHEVPMETKNRNLHSAKRAKNDEFYTQLVDIENELRHYSKHFKGKVVLCNCDDPRVSNFFHYFSHNFGRLGLKKLITICYKNQEMDLFSKNDNEQAIYLEYTGTKNKNDVPSIEEIGIKHLEGDGDFRSIECIELLKQADIVVTNPPFSLFREYVAQLVEYEKKFLIIGNMNAISYKEVFPLLKDNKIWFGNNHKVNGGAMFFEIAENIANLDQVREIQMDKNGRKKYITRVQGVRWFTNLSHARRNEELVLVKKYKGNEKDYPKYDNYDAIEVSKVADIPSDFNGVMGVPGSFFDKYNPEQFEIIGQMVTTTITKFNFGYPYINKKKKYARVLIKRKGKPK
jgi:hypothetical protein